MTLSSIGSIALMLVALQLAATLVCQASAFDARFGRLDMLGILPRWKFFINERGTFDLAVEFRGRTDAHWQGEWRTIWEPRRRGRWAWLWNPDALADGVVWLAVSTLEARHEAGKPACPATSWSYAMLLELCRRDASATGQWREGQFALIRVTTDGLRRVQFTSPFHPL